MAYSFDVSIPQDEYQTSFKGCLGPSSFTTPPPLVLSRCFVAYYSATAAAAVTMNRTGTSTSTTGLGYMNFGNGLVEIGALTTLIGSNSAGDLALGNRGSAGIVWGSITTFGNSSVVKACAGAALPGWLRHVLGLRTRAADEAVGMDLPLVEGRKGKFAQAVRSRELSGPLGLVSESDVFDEDVRELFLKHGFCI